MLQIKYVQEIKNKYQYMLVKVLYFLSCKKPWKILYRGLIPKEKRLKLEQVQFEQMRQQAVAYFWQRKIQAYQTGHITSLPANSTPKAVVPPKVIWQYWAQGWDEALLPPIVQLCRVSVDKYCGDYTVIRLDDSNVSDYLDIPDFVSYKRHHQGFKAAFYSDLIRVMLLNAYGGVWLDATILLTDRLPEKYTIPDLFMFQRSNAVANKSIWMALNQAYFSWSERHYINSLNSIIFAQKDAKTLAVMQDLLLDFWKTQNSVAHYFFFQILFNEIKKSPYAPESYPPVDDTLPHLLHLMWNQPIIEEKVTQIFDQNSMHKLTYMSLGEPGTVGAYVAQYINSVADNEKSPT